MHGSRTHGWIRQSDPIDSQQCVFVKRGKIAVFKNCSSPKNVFFIWKTAFFRELNLTDCRPMGARCVWNKFVGRPMGRGRPGETNRPAGQSERGASETIRWPANGARAAWRNKSQHSPEDRFRASAKDAEQSSLLPHPPCAPWPHPLLAPVWPPCAPWPHPPTWV